MAAQECETCKKIIASGMWWVHLEDHQRGRINDKPTLRKRSATEKVLGGYWVCSNCKGNVGAGKTPAEAYKHWRLAIDY